MGRLLTILGITEEQQSKLTLDVLETEDILIGLQNLYASTPESPNKDKLALAVSEGAKLLLQEVKKQVGEHTPPPPHSSLPSPQPQQPTLKPKPVQIPQRVSRSQPSTPQKPQTGMPSSAPEPPTSETAPQTPKPKRGRPPKPKPTSPEQPPQTYKPKILILASAQSKPSETAAAPEPSKPKSKRGRPKKKPQVSHDFSNYTCDEIKESIGGLKVLAQLGDEEAKTDIKNLKLLLKSKNCK